MIYFPNRKSLVPFFMYNFFVMLQGPKTANSLPQGFWLYCVEAKIISYFFASLKSRSRFLEPNLCIWHNCGRWLPLTQKKSIRSFRTNTGHFQTSVLHQITFLLAPEFTVLKGESLSTWKLTLRKKGTIWTILRRGNTDFKATTVLTMDLKILCNVLTKRLKGGSF